MCGIFTFLFPRGYMKTIDDILGDFVEGNPVQVLDQAALRVQELLGLPPDILKHKTGQYRIDFIQLYVQLDALLGGSR
jgi:hypothetical protein